MENPALRSTSEAGVIGKFMAMKLLPNRATIPRTLLRIAIACCVAFMLLIAAAMMVFPGGTMQNHAEAHYRFFQNPFSDLGRTHAFDGRSNTVCMTLFIAAMIAGALGVAVFFVAFARLARSSKLARLFSSLGALLGISAALGFLGVACTPWDLYMHTHIQFVFLAFRSLLVATVFDLLAVLVDGTLSRRLIGPFATFICLLIAYIILLTAGVSGGPGSDAVLQATGQKAIVFSAILMVLVQSAQLCRQQLATDH